MTFQISQIACEIYKGNSFGFVLFVMRLLRFLFLFSFFLANFWKNL